MNLKELKPPLIELPAGQTFFRVQLLRARPGTVKTNGLLLPPAGVLSGRFCLPDQVTAYLADSADTALFESQFRRDTVSRSLGDLRKRALLRFATTRPLRLVDLRPLAEPYPLLQSLRIAQTQALARDCFTAGLQGLVYASAQHPQHACLCLFPNGMAALKRQQQWPLVKPGTRQLLHAVVDAARRSGVPLLGSDASE
jgi:phytoene dehydrogenase-like protein